MSANKRLTRQSRIVLVATAVVAAVVIYCALSAQTHDYRLPGNQNGLTETDFSTFSQKASEARSSFNVSAEVVTADENFEVFEAIDDLSEIDGQNRLGLAVSPPRLVFEGDLKTATLTLTNIGELETVYRILLVNTLIDENGNRSSPDEEELPELKRQGAMFAHRLLKFAPRMVRLKPQEQQTIRVAVRAPAKLEDGEYRSELNFTWMRDSEEILDIDQFNQQLATHTASAPARIIIRDEPGKEIFVPVIVRKGELEATGKLTDLQLASTEETTTLKLTITREGNRSLHGDLLIYGLNRDNEKSELMQTVCRLAVYPPAEQQTVSVDVSEAVKKAGEDVINLMLEYKASADEGGATIDTAEINLLTGARASAKK